VVYAREQAGAEWKLSAREKRITNRHEFTRIATKCKKGLLFLFLKIRADS
jgi:hypothetical protein